EGKGGASFGSLPTKMGGSIFINEPYALPCQRFPVNLPFEAPALGETQEKISCGMHLQPNGREIQPDLPVSRIPAKGGKYRLLVLEKASVIIAPGAFVFVQVARELQQEQNISSHDQQA